jgi:hypothetical protein
MADTYNTINGQQTQATMAQQLQNAGWGGNTNDAGAVASAYASTTGGAVTPMAAVNSGGGGGTSGGGGGGGGAAPPTTDLSGLANFAAQTSGVTQAQLAQQKQEFDAQLAFAQQQMQQLGIPQLQINQYLAQMQQQQFQSQLLLAQQAQQYSQAATTAGLTGYFTPPPGVPGVSQFTQPNQPSLTNPTAPLPGAGGAAGGASTYPPGSVVRTGSNQFGVVNANGSISPQSDANWPQIYQAIQQGSGILTIPDSAFQQGISMPSSTQPAASATPGAAAAPGAGGGPVQTLAGQLQQAQLSGVYQGAPTETAREFNQNLALQQGQLGQQYLATAAQLQGPQNTFQLSNYLRGAQGNQSVPVYLQNLANNVAGPTFQAPGSTPPTPQSAAGIASQLGGTSSATPGWNYNDTLGTIQNIMQRGAQGLQPGALEQMSPEELQAFGSGLGAAGGSLPSFMQQYAASRVGQTAPVGATSLA